MEIPGIRYLGELKNKLLSGMQKKETKVRQDYVRGQVKEILGFRNEDIVRDGISLRKEISDILNGKTEPSYFDGDEWTLYDYVMQAREGKKRICNNELTDMLIDYLKRHQELIYINSNRILIGKFCL